MKKLAEAVRLKGDGRGAYTPAYRLQLYLQQHERERQSNEEAQLVE